MASYIAHPLPRSFRYLHEPLRRDDVDSWLVGRSRLARQMADRLMLSSGGAFLVTGFRGVGKTSFVNQTLGLIDGDRVRYAEETGPFELVDVWLNLARPIEPVQLMHHLIRHLGLRLQELGLSERFDPPLCHDLETAFLRTTFEISSGTSHSDETSRDAAVQGKWLGLELLGKLSSSHKTTAEEALRYLPYDERAAEFDIISLSRRLAREGVPAPRLKGWWQRLHRWLWPRPRRAFDPAPSRRSVKVVFVLDELDKLDGHADGDSRSPLDTVLESLKTVFTSTAFSFVFVAGKELRERWTREVALGDSIYESVFAYDVYLPCLWQEQDQLLRRFVGGAEVPAGGDAAGDLESVLRYLAYKGRGIPRRLLRELNRHVVWEGGRPLLVLDHEQGRFVRVFAKLQEIVAALLEDLVAQPSYLVDKLRFDSQCLTFYYSFDWLMFRGRRPFGPEKLQQVALDLNLGTRREARVSEQFAQRLIEILLERSVIEQARPVSTALDLNEVSAKAEYRLTPWVAEALEALPAADRPSAEVERQDFEVIGQYRRISKLGEGGFGEVFKVVGPDGTARALKLLRLDDAGSVARFRREVKILSALDHPNIVKFHDSGFFEGRPYFVMDYVDGASLKQLLVGQSIPPPAAIALAEILARALDYVQHRNISRVDVKPSNILISAAGIPKLVDFGIAKTSHDENITATGIVIGTVSYLSPEEIRGEPADPKGDVFSLAVVLYEMLTGQVPFQGQTISSTLYQILHEKPVAPSRLVAISPELDALVMEALSKKLEDRPSMAELAASLEALRTPVDLAALVAAGRRPPAREIQQWREATAISPLEEADQEIEDEPKRGDTVEMPFALESSPDSPPVPRPIDSAQALVLLRAAEATVRRQAFEVLRSNSPEDEGDILFDFAEGICLFSGDREVTAAALLRGRLNLGRSKDVDLFLARRDLSRHHAEFLITEGGVEVEDLGSSNGLFLHGERITRGELHDGDTLRLGDLHLRIHIYGEPASNDPPPADIEGVA